MTGIILQGLVTQRGSRMLRSLLAAGLASAVVFLLVPAATASRAGDLDPTFGVGGLVLDPQSSRALAVTATPNNKFISAGCHGRNCEETILARYDNTGKLDSDFGEHGVARFDLNNTPGFEGIEAFTALRIRETGSTYKIVAAGEVSGRFALASFNADGTLDDGGPGDATPSDSFGNGGLALGPPGSATSLTRQSSTGKWVLAGRTMSGPTQGEDFLVARFNADGTLDDGGADDETPGDSFGNGGHATVDITDLPLDFSRRIDGADGVVADAAGIYAVGYSGPPDTGPQERSVAAIRLDHNGQLDPSFAGDGIFIGPPGSLSSAILQQDAASPGQFKLVAAGRIQSRLAVIRLDSNGTMDGSFGDGGVALGPTGRAAALIEQGTALLAAGRNISHEDFSTMEFEKAHHRDALIARFDSEGKLDANFGTEGHVVADFGENVDEATGVTLDASDGGDPKFVIAGQSGEFRSYKFALARFQAAARTEQVSLGLALRGGPDPVAVGAKHIWETTIINRGPQNAFGVQLRQSVPDEVHDPFTSIESSQGVCSRTGSTIDCNLGGILSGRTAKVTVTVVATAPGVAASSASIVTSSSDSDSSDNSATVTTTVVPGEGVFTPAGDLNEDRSDHAAVLLEGDPCTGLIRPLWCGRVLLIGRGTSELYDPRADRWIPVQDPLKADHGSDFTATVLSDGRVLVVGSPDASTVSPAETYLPWEGSSGAWTPIDGPDSPRDGHAAVKLADGRVLVAGGRGNENEEVDCRDGREGGASLKSAEIFDITKPEELRWEPAGEMQTGRAAVGFGATATLLANGDVLVVGGDKGRPWSNSGPAGGDPDACDGTGPLAGGEIFDPESKTGMWRDTGGPEILRNGHTATVLPDNTVLIAGGNTTVGDVITTANAVIYDPFDTSSGVKGSWRNTNGLMIFGRAYHAAALLPNNKVLITGGLSIPRKGDDYPPITAELYDPATRVFTSAGIFLATDGRSKHTATTLGPGPVTACGANCGKVLLAGGVESSGLLDRLLTGDLLAGDTPTAAPPVHPSELYTSPPRVTGLEPPTGPVIGGTPVTIFGTALASTTRVTFEGEAPLVCGNKQEARCWVDEELPDSKIHALSPPHSIPEKVHVVVETYPGLVSAQSDADLFGYKALPKTPERGLAPPGSNDPPPVPPPPTVPSGSPGSAPSSGVAESPGVAAAPGVLPPTVVAPGAAASASQASQIAQSLQSSAATEAALLLGGQPEAGYGLSLGHEKEPEAAPRITFSAVEQAGLAAAWAGAALLTAGFVFCSISRRRSPFKEPTAAAGWSSSGVPRIHATGADPGHASIVLRGNAESG